MQPARPMGPRRALPTPPTRIDPPAELLAALGPPPSAIETSAPPLPLPRPSFLNPGAPSATPIPSPMPSPGLPPFQAPPPPPPLPNAPSDVMRASRTNLYTQPSSRPVAPLNINRARPRVEVPRHQIPSDIDSADADDEKMVRRPRPQAYERSNLVPVDAPSPGPMVGRIGGSGAGRPKLGLRTASGSALPDDDAPAPPPVDSSASLTSLRPVDTSASLTSLRPQLQLGGGKPSRPKLGLALPGSEPKSTPSLKLDLSAARQNDSEDDADYSYYGFNSNRKPSVNLLGGSESFPSDSSQATLQPPSTTTAKPISVGRVDDGLADVRRAINELRMPELEEELEAREEQQEWNDDMLEVEAHLGEGAGGAVCRVKDRRTGRVMARKTIPTGTVPARQLLRELQFSKLVHPNLIVCYGAYISTPPPDPSSNPSNSSDYTPEIHILMELGEGGALDSIARQMKTRHANVRIGEKVIARLAEGVLKGLDYMHSNKVTHRDIKPSNILVTRQGVVKLCDFGVSGQLEASLASTFTGTSWYMAPERITGHAYSIRADVWSTGLTFLELAQNRFPYPPDLGPIELLTYIVNGEVPELDDEPGDENGNGAITWTDGMKSFIKLCLRIDAATRPTPKEMLEHPWIQESMARKLDMAKWIREVWGWEKPKKRSSQV